MPNASGSEKDNKEGLAPLKELAGPKGIGFKNLPELKEILGNLKELNKIEGFKELSAFKDILKPVKEIDLFASNDGKGNKNGNAKQEGTDSNAKQEGTESNAKQEGAESSAKHEGAESNAKHEGAKSKEGNDHKK